MTDPHTGDHARRVVNCHMSTWTLPYSQGCLSSLLRYRAELLLLRRPDFSTIKTCYAGSVAMHYPADAERAGALRRALPDQPALPSSAGRLFTPDRQEKFNRQMKS